MHAEHAGPLSHYLLRATSGDRQWAENVVQKTPPRAWRHPAAFDPARGPALARLRPVARHPVIDAHRARTQASRHRRAGWLPTPCGRCPRTTARHCRRPAAGAGAWWRPHGRRASRRAP
ncbi:sigma factor [Streptomyces sp. NPDC088354]|uniref:sigma factor n=1 Tax=unclassified Streptomyces TaxID=2593676 RepID=UPI00381A0C2A